MKSEYEKLKEQGYTEEQINVILQNMNRVKIDNDPMGLNRDDRSVHIENPNGMNMRTSNIMMGLNRSNIILDNGEYANEEELIKALQDELNNSSENKIIICKKTGKKYNVEDLVKILVDISKKEGTLVIGNSNPKINNQRTASIGIKPKDYHDIVKKGYLMLGNKGVQLSSGEYIQMSEIQKALADYVYMIPLEKTPDPIVPPEPTPAPTPDPIVPPEPTPEPTPDPVVPPEPTPAPTPDPIVPPEPTPVPTPDPVVPPRPTPDPIVPSGQIKPGPVTPKIPGENHKVVKRRKGNFKIWPLVLAAILTALLGFKYNQKAVTISEIEKISSLNYIAYGIREETRLANENEILQRVTSDIKTGDTTEIAKGTNYYASSDYQYGGNSSYGTFGSTVRPEGVYTIDYISIINNGKIDEVVYEQGKNLGNVIEEYCQKNNTDISNLDIKLHIGGPVSGWVNLNDVLNKNDLAPQVKSTKTVLDNRYEGSLRSHDEQQLLQTLAQNDLHINVDGKDVSLKVVDSNGNLLPQGSTIIGSDGQEYKLTKLSLKNTKELNLYEEKTDKELNWSIQNINKELALLIAAGGIVGTYLVNIKKKETKKDSNELDEKTMQEFLEAKKRYKDQSIFKKIGIILDGKKPDWNKIQNMLENGKMSIDDIGNMYR